MAVPDPGLRRRSRSSKADSFTLHTNGQAEPHPGPAAQPMFDDTNQYFRYRELPGPASPSRPTHGVRIGGRRRPPGTARPLTGARHRCASPSLAPSSFDRAAAWGLARRTCSPSVPPDRRPASATDRRPGVLRRRWPTDRRRRTPTTCSPSAHGPQPPAAGDGGRLAAWPSAGFPPGVLGRLPGGRRWRTAADRGADPRASTTSTATSSRRPGRAAGIEGIDAGGAEYLATHVAALEAPTPTHVVVSAGDLIGASPLLSALFHDEPTIEAMNQIGLDLNAVGNHEFDEGTDELLRMQKGGCHPVDGCLDGDDFAGADFEFLAANVVVESRGGPLFPPYTIEQLRRQRQGRLHRHDPGGHAHHRHPRGRGRLRLPRRGRHRQRPGRPQLGAGRREHRRAAPRGAACHRRRLQRLHRHLRVPSSTSSTASTTRSTRSSAATPTRPTTA